MYNEVYGKADQQNMSYASYGVRVLLTWFVQNPVSRVVTNCN